MKRIRKLFGSTPGLNAYLKECSDSAKSWSGFRDHRDHRDVSSYRALIEALCEHQHGLCGYCEIDLKELDRQVEHVIPQSDPSHGASQALNVGNMIACCRGGDARYLDDEARYLQPAKRNRSCGQAKGAERITVDPRAVPALPSVTKVNMDGRIEADLHACSRCGFDARKVTGTIALLGLNAERLRMARERHWSALNRSWGRHFEDSSMMAAAARSELLPDATGMLPRFFTTSRSWFGDLGERLLNRHRQWV